MKPERPDNCPACGSLWRGEEIPREHLHLYGGSLYYSRVVAIYDRDLDCRTHYECPDCKATFTLQFEPLAAKV